MVTYNNNHKVSILLKFTLIRGVDIISSYTHDVI